MLVCDHYKLKDGHYVNLIEQVGTTFLCRQCSREMSEMAFVTVERYCDCLNATEFNNERTPLMELMRDTILKESAYELPHHEAYDVPEKDPIDTHVNPFFNV